MRGKISFFPRRSVKLQFYVFPFFTPLPPLQGSGSLPRFCHCNSLLVSFPFWLKISFCNPLLVFSRVTQFKTKLFNGTPPARGLPPRGASFPPRLITHTFFHTRPVKLFSCFSFSIFPCLGICWSPFLSPFFLTFFMLLFWCLLDLPPPPPLRFWPQSIYGHVPPVGVFLGWGRFTPLIYGWTLLPPKDILSDFLLLHSFLSYLTPPFFSVFFGQRWLFSSLFLTQYIML